MIPASTILSIPRQWEERASELTDAIKRLFAPRRDAWGGYLPLSQRDGSRKSVTKPSVSNRGKRFLTDEMIAAHFRGLRPEDVIGIYPAGLDNLCSFVALDIDQHINDIGDAGDINLNAAFFFYDLLKEWGFRPWLIDSNGNGGFHIWVIFSQPINTEAGYDFGRWLASKFQEAGLPKAPESFPKQRIIEPGKYGNWIRMPGRHHTTEVRSQIFDGDNWREGDGAASFIVETEGDDPSLIPAEALIAPEDDPIRAQAQVPEAHRRSSDDIIERCLTHIPNPDLHYDEWFAVLAAAKSAGDTCRATDAARQWSRQSEKHDDATFDRTWARITRSTGAMRTVGTLVHMARQAGFDVFAEAARERQAASTSSSGTAENMGEPIPLESAPPPPLPEGIFTGWIGDQIYAAAAATETPPEMAAIFALASLATASQGRFCVRPAPDYFEPLPFWGAVGMPPGTRKTPVMLKMSEWIFSWQRRRSRALERDIRHAQANFDIASNRIKELRTRAVKTSNEAQRRDFQQQAQRMEDNITPVPVAPRLLVEDVTPEHLATLMTQYHERLSIISDEGGFIDNFAGRYNPGTVNLDLLLKAHTGAPCTQDRGSRPPAHLRHPLLSIGIAPQPSVIAAMVGNDVFRRRGLPARFVFLMPQSRLGYRTLDTQPIPPAVSSEYAQRLTALVEMEGEQDGNGEFRPRVLSLSGGAWHIWRDFAAEVEAAMRPDGDLALLTDWAGKLPGCAARIAGLFHLAGRGPDAVHRPEIHQATMARAIAFCRFAIPHAKAVFEGLNDAGDMELARRIWRETSSERWREARRSEHGDPTIVTARELWTPLRGTSKTTAQIEPGIRLLIDHNFLRELPNAEHGRPGRPSRRFQINPKLTTEW